MRSQIRGLGQAQKNIQDGVSMVQTAEGNLDEVHSMLQRVRELAVQYKNGSLDDNARTAIQTEVTQLASEISRIGSSASFNGINLLDGTTTVSFQVGANDGAADRVSLINLATTVGTSFSTLSTAGTHRHLRDRHGHHAPSRPLARRSVRCRTASSTRCRSRRSTRRT